MIYMKRMLIAVIVLVAVFSYSSCYYDKEELLYGNAVCDTTGTISYANQVVPIFQQHCYSCHTGSFPSGNIQMGTYAADGVIAANGKLYGSISHASGYVPMPQGAPKMTDCQIATVKKWIDEGMKNN